jgi:hypothetical protein
VKNAPIGETNTELQENQHTDKKNKISFFRQEIQTSFGEKEKRYSNANNGLSNPEDIQITLQKAQKGAIV